MSELSLMTDIVFYKKYKYVTHFFVTLTSVSGYWAEDLPNLGGCSFLREHRMHRD